jgi:aryl carrier-like protein
MAMTPEDIRDLDAEMDALGEIRVRHLMRGEHWGALDSIRRTYVDAWLRTKETERDIDFATTASHVTLAASDAVLAAREANDLARAADSTAKDALSTAKDALRTARQARTAAIVAAIAAIIAAVVAIIK